MSEIQHSGRAHARLNASSSYRWMMCPPSVKLSEQFEDKPSTYAEEGTFCHELCELKLHRYLGDMTAEAVEAQYAEHALARQTLQANREKTNVQKPTTARYPFSGRIVCGCCGQHYRRRTNVSRITWQCWTYLQRGKAFCPAKQIPEETLYRITEEALGVKEITEESLTVLKEIRVPKDNHLVFVFQDGREAERVWKDRSRAESWTEEMREQARLHNLKRKKGGNQG